MNHFSGKTSSPAKNSHLPTLSDNKSEILAAYYSILAALLCSILLSVYLIFSSTVIYDKSFLNLYGLSADKVVSFTKIDYGSLVYSS